MRKAVFLDRDGVLNELSKKDEAFGFILKESELQPINGTIEALKIIKNENYLRIVVTNQPAVARGLITESEINKLHDVLNSKLNGLINAFYYCPHHPEMHDDIPVQARKYRIACNCRKPAIGMLLQAVKNFNIDLALSWMIGDMASDIATGQNAGCKTILVKSASNSRIIASSVSFNPDIKPDFFVSNLREACEKIIGNKKSR